MYKIDWKCLSDPVSNNFKVKDCLFLPRWNRLADEHDGLNLQIKHNLILLCLKLDILQKLFKTPMVVNGCYRSPSYNALLGEFNENYTQGKAIDLHVSQMACDKAIEALKDHIEGLNMKLEYFPGSSWITLSI